MDTIALLRLVLVVLALMVSEGLAQRTIIVPVGGILVLELDPRPPRVEQVLWKHGSNLLAELSDGEFDFYGSFKGHTELDHNGRLNVSNIKLEEGGQYSVEVNYRIQTIHYNVKVYEVLTQPWIWVTPLTCGTNPAENCTLVCKLEPDPSTAVNYEWKLDGKVSEISGKELTKATNFTCQAKNPVSEQVSKSTKNPFLRKLTGSGLWLRFGLRLTVAFFVLILGVAGIVYSFKKKNKQDFYPDPKQPSETVGFNTTQM